MPKDKNGLNAKATKTASPKSAPRSKKGATTKNPFFQTWDAGPFVPPPFDEIRPEHFSPAFREGMKRHKAEIKAIADNLDKPSFSNTLGALERAGALLTRTGAIFWNLASSDSSDALRDIENTFAPKLAAHFSEIMLDARLFGRIDALWQDRSKLALNAAQMRLLERVHTNFVRSGAKLDRKAKARVKAINGRLASLTSKFMQNVLKDEQSWTMALQESDLTGLPENLVTNARAAARDLNLPVGSAAITLARSSVEGFITFSDRRDLRERAFKAWISRGDHPGDNDNRPVLKEIVQLRAELARIMGFESFAHYAIADNMAKTPEAVAALLDSVWSKAKAQAISERTALSELAAKRGDDPEIAAWDWRYYAEILRRRDFDFDESALRPYLSLNEIIEAGFFTAEKLFGLRFSEAKDLTLYHREARVWEVTDKTGAPIGLFIGDYFARPSKRSGAWMSAFRVQNKLDADIRPIIVNVLNFAKSEEGGVTLLSVDDARTLFHEFGHALHGLMSDVAYPTLAGTAVASDFVELPSQLYEHWFLTPEILSRFARHWKTTEAPPKEMLDNFKTARNFNQGFATVEFTASALMDLALYSQKNVDNLDITAFEAETLAKIGMPPGIVMRHRLPHFMHIVSGYAAGYYSYMWSEVMDADAFAAFTEAGDVFDRPTARKLAKFIYSAGNLRDSDEAYKAFRGRPPKAEGLLAKRGLAG